FVEADGTGVPSLPWSISSVATKHSLCMLHCALLEGALVGKKVAVLYCFQPVGISDFPQHVFLTNFVA
ncbi:MAG: hypothetical protein IJ724_00070, partial [Muribaculaceae bacterium]|nr:hypothetical protein [Muribaculaceae bacterium]